MRRTLTALVLISGFYSITCLAGCWDTGSRQKAQPTHATSTGSPPSPPWVWQNGTDQESTWTLDTPQGVFYKFYRTGEQTKIWFVPKETVRITGERNAEAVELPK